MCLNKKNTSYEFSENLRQEVNDLKDHPRTSLHCKEVQRDSWVPREGNSLLFTECWWAETHETYEAKRSAWLPAKKYQRDSSFPWGASLQVGISVRQSTHWGKRLLVKRYIDKGHCFIITNVLLSPCQLYILVLSNTNVRLGIKTLDSRYLCENIRCVGWRANQSDVLNNREWNFKNWTTLQTSQTLKMEMKNHNVHYKNVSFRHREWFSFSICKAHRLLMWQLVLIVSVAPCSSPEDSWYIFTSRYSPCLFDICLNGMFISCMERGKKVAISLYNGYNLIT